MCRCHDKKVHSVAALNRRLPIILKKTDSLRTVQRKIVLF